MKVGPVTKIDKKNKKTSKKKLMLMSCQQIVILLLFRLSMASLEQSGSWIPDAYSVKLTFSLTVTFYFTKTENRTKKSLHLSHYCFE